MIFDKNKTEFSTMVHRDIYMTALRLTPPEISLAEIEKADPELAKSGREFYAFMVELLADMYIDPCMYGMNPGAYEEFMDGRRYFEVKRYQSKKTNAVGGQSSAELFSYFGFLKAIGTHCEVKDGKCVISVGDYEKAKEQKLKKEVANLAISNETVIKMFERIGLRFTINNDNSVTVINEKYPHMFTAMSALAKAADNSIKNPVSRSAKYYYAVNYDFLEFRQIPENYWPDYADVTRYLPDNKRALIEELRKITEGYNMRETYSNYGGNACIDYQYKSKPILHIWTDGLWLEPHREQKHWIRSVSISIRGSWRPEYQQKVKAYGEDFVKYFNRHLNYCGCCNPDHVKGRSGIQQVLGENVRICGAGPGGVIKNPTMGDLPYIQKYIDLRIEEILAGV